MASTSFRVKRSITLAPLPFFPPSAQRSWLGIEINGQTQAGTKLGRYEIRSKIGEGGMGEVYLAQDTKTRSQSRVEDSAC